MDPHLTRDLLAILNATTIHSATSFSFAGRRISCADDVQARNPQDDEQGPVVRHLVPYLYHYCFCRRFNAVLRDDPWFPRPDDGFVKELSQANAGREREDHGWQIVSALPPEHYVAQKNGLVRMLAGSDCTTDGKPVDSFGAGVTVSLRWRRESTALQPSFYVVFGETIADQQDEFDLVKLYWNIAAAGAPTLVHALTSQLNRSQMPFRFKCLSNPAAYDRADAAVLYINTRFYCMAASLLADVHRDAQPFLAPSVPLFTRQVAHGVGLGEEPDNGESFGQQRCRFLAEGVWNGYRRNRLTLQERVEEIDLHFAHNGLTLDAPHLKPRSVDRYCGFHVAPHLPVGVPERLPASAVQSRSGSFLETADRLGWRLCRDAIWAGNRCSWLAAAAPRVSGPRRVAVHRACGIDLFSGTAGIAGFLGRLHRRTGEKVAALTAEGAIRHSISRLDDVPLPERRAFYTGLTGVAYVLCELADALQVPKFDAMAVFLLQQMTRDDVPDRSDVLIAERTAAVAALLRMARKHSRDFLLDLAVKYGRTIRHQPDAPGVAWALLALWHATGDNTFRRDAEQALAADWDRFRESTAARGESTEPTPWSAGASTIGITRLRAFERLHDSRYLAESKAALHSVIDGLTRWADVGVKDFSLGFGIAGDAELLLQAGSIDGVSTRSTAEHVGRGGSETHGSGDVPWPCGIRGAGETPGLMLGLAGIGDFYVALDEPLPTPTYLMVDPEIDW